jgi:GrpB-like predicted nucleotidyltransferase (UPF0157 family)
MKVTLVEKYNPEWPKWFEEIKTFLGEKLAKACLRIEHAGSTSIPGMIAKPIIDINIVIKPETWEQVKTFLEERGYHHEGDLGIKDREAFKFYDEALKKSLPDHHMYVTPEHSEELKRQIAFRDYHKTHPADRERLGALKWSLAEKFDNDKYPYMNGKDVMVKEITRKALEYFQNTGKCTIFPLT